MDLEIIVEDEPCETLLINDIDANGYLVNSEFESEIRDNVDVHMRADTEGDNDNGVMGMVFDSPDDAYAFYNQYALLHGFGIRIHTTYKNRITKEHYRKIYVCNKEGFKEMKGETSRWNLKKRRRDSRTGCEAKIRISKRKDGKWFVDIFSDVHNHELTMSPAKVMKHRSHGKLHRSLACKTLMTELSQSGLRPCQIKKVVNTMKSPLENEVTSKQCADVLAESRKQYRGKEFYGVIKYFQEKITKDPNLHFIVDLYEDGSPRNLFWADGHSMLGTRTHGILCKHILYVLKKKHVETVPDHYILPRWTLDARYKEDSCSVRIEDIDSERAVNALTLWCVQSNSTKAIEQAKDSLFEIKKLNTLLLNFLEEQTNRKGSKEAGNLHQDPNVESSQVNMMPQISIRDPLLPTVTKGRPKKACRIKSSLEAPKKKTCSYSQ